MQEQVGGTLKILLWQMREDGPQWFLYNDSELIGALQYWNILLFKQWIFNSLFLSVKNDTLSL